MTPAANNFLALLNRLVAEGRLQAHDADQLRHAFHQSFAHRPMPLVVRNRRGGRTVQI
jgi:hypothetical protein